MESGRPARVPDGPEQPGQLTSVRGLLLGKTIKVSTLFSDHGHRDEVS